MSKSYAISIGGHTLRQWMSRWAKHQSVQLELGNGDSLILSADLPEGKLTEKLLEIRELIEGYVDVRDCGAMGQQPNHAMRAQQLIDEAIAVARGE